MTSGRGPRAVGTVLLVVALLAIAWLVLASPLFRISTLQVDGNRRLSDEEISGLTGTGPGANLVFLSPEDVEAALESSPWVRDAVVERSFPDVLIVHVSERRPVAFARYATTAYLIAEDGLVLEAVDRPPPFPSLGRYTAVRVGERVHGPLDAIRALAALSHDVLRRIREAGVLGDVTPPEVLLLVGDSRVLFGPATELRAKAAALAGILRWAEERGVRFRYIDVSVPDAPVLRPRGRDEVTPQIELTP